MAPFCDIILNVALVKQQGNSNGKMVILVIFAMYCDSDLELWVVAGSNTYWLCFSFESISVTFMIKSGIKLQAEWLVEYHPLTQVLENSLLIKVL